MELLRDSGIRKGTFFITSVIMYFRSCNCPQCMPIMRCSGSNYIDHKQAYCATKPPQSKSGWVWISQTYIPSLILHLHILLLRPNLSLIWLIWHGSETCAVCDQSRSPFSAPFQVIQTIRSKQCCCEVTKGAAARWDVMAPYMRQRASTTKTPGWNMRIGIVVTRHFGDDVGLIR